MWSCRLTQRTDFEYEKLRWQPKDCKMQEFTSSNYLRRYRQFLFFLQSTGSYGGSGIWEVDI